MKLMKRILLIALSLLLLFSLAACRSVSDEEANIAAGENQRQNDSTPEPEGDAAPGDGVASADAAETGEQPNYYIPKPAAPKTAPVEDAADAAAEEPEEPEADQQPDATEENPETEEPAQTETAAAPAEPYLLTITGNGVTATTTWTLNQLKALTAGYRKVEFSTTSNWPRYGRAAAEGVAIPYLLRQAGLSDNAATFRLIGADGNYTLLTYQQMFGESYSYANHSAAGSSGATAVEPLLAWAWEENGATGGGVLRSFLGQRGPQEVNTAASISNLCQIEVTTAAPGRWTAPTADPASGSVVTPGAALRLGHGKLDQVHIYYTLDGSEPDYNSYCYNPSASYLQPELLKPLQLTEDITIKAFAAAYGMDASPVATFYYQVE